MKKTLILKNPTTRVKVYQKHMVIASDIENTVIGYIHIETLYINKTIPLSSVELLKLASFFKVYFIDHNGYILASIKLGS
jgi:hypothetical protein